MLRLSASAFPAAVLLALIALSAVSAQDPWVCDGVENSNCDTLASCMDVNIDGSVTKTCVCPEGTVGDIDFLTNDPPFTSGVCNKNLHSVRIVRKEDDGLLDNVDGLNAALKLCAGSYGAQGAYLRDFHRYEPLVEVNCLYVNKTEAELDVPAYASDASVIAGPDVYTWVLPTTSTPIKIAPTGLTVESVSFDTTCANSGCWVIKGIMTSGEAFNDFTAFNTFYLPHAVGDDTLSVDFDYSVTGSDEAWTFAPADAPCSSVDYEAGDTESIFRVSPCCITEPTKAPTNVADQTGGMIANYRPTKEFVKWWTNENKKGLAGVADRKCDAVYEAPDGTPLKCWASLVRGSNKENKDTADQAFARCKAAGGSLPIIESDEENQQFLAAALEIYGGSEYVWIGGRDRHDGSEPINGNELPSVFKDSDGNNLTYYNWGPNEPNNFDWGLFGEDCIEMRLIQNSNNAEMVPGTWRDQSCAQLNSISNYLCEFTFEEVCTTTVISRPAYSAPPPHATPCWSRHGGKNKQLNYTDAMADCVAKGGNLAKVDTAEKFHLMRRMLKDLPASEDAGTVWIGLDDLADEGKFAWAIGDNVPIDLDSAAYLFTGWRTVAVRDDPTGWPYSWVDPANGDTDFNCVSVTSNGRWWEDYQCDEEMQYICELPRQGEEECESDKKNEDPVWTVPFPVNYPKFMTGKFKGMDVSPGVVEFNNLDPYFGKFEFKIELDEVELRQNAGILTGTVGVEHTIDTFLGLTNFRPTGLASGVLDTFSTQTAIHLEKTNFFSVSTHGENQYTFLEYVNMRLVSVYNQDIDFSGLDETTVRTVRTDSAGNANYVQVTFTLGEEYSVNDDPEDDIFTSGLIPLDSVRVGQGVFFDTVEAAGGMEHVCSEYKAVLDSQDIGLSAGRVKKETFDDQMAQDCGPKSTMCKSPESIPDNFVSFNIPLGKEIFESPADDLSNNIFVSLVVNALEAGATPAQMKTTLAASIPIVAGGINIFCDGVTSKTDLKDVANADIIVGTADSEDELSRLRIVEDVANTDLAKDLTDNVVDSASIEEGLITLVLKGNTSYFAPESNRGANTRSYSLELDDVITIHIMESASANPNKVTKETDVVALLNEPAEDNTDTNGLMTAGYKLNGAFYFTVERDATGNPGNTVARLEPTPELITLCPFNPVRPDITSNVPLETCITRRDVAQRTYPIRTGADFPTAMEIFNSNLLESEGQPWNMNREENRIESQKIDGGAPCRSTFYKDGSSSVVAWTDEEYGCEAGFMTSVLGDSMDVRRLGKNFVTAIRSKYDLNGRYVRAYWINPGYEWTPTQTGGASRFSISQKVFLFALITLDENWSRRRMLLQVDPTESTGSGLSASKIQYDVDMKTLMASSYTTTVDRIAQFDVQVQLTFDEACMKPEDLQESIRATFEDYLTAAASKTMTVQVTSLTKELNDVVCDRRSLSRSLLSFSEATADVSMMIVFAPGETSKFNPDLFQSQPGINSVEPDPANTGSLVKLDSEYKCSDNCGQQAPSSSDDDSGSSSTALIAGVAGGVGGALLVAVGVLIFMRSRRQPEVATAHAVQTIDVNALKAQLSDV